MNDLRGRDQGPPGQGPPGPGQGRDGVFQRYDTSSSSSSEHVNSAFNAELLRIFLSLSSTPAPGYTNANANANAELLRQFTLVGTARFCSVKPSGW
jgi:hypothetical protein